MKKTILAAVPLALLALAVPSAAQAKRAQTYKAKLGATAGSTVRGKAQLVDGKRRDKVRVRVRGLEAGATYGWSLRKAPAGGDACTGSEVASFSYATLRTRRHGAGGRARTKGFAAGDGAYAVVIEDEQGEAVACLELKSEAQRRAEREDAQREQDEQGDDDGASGDDDELDDEPGDGGLDDDPFEDDGAL